MIAELITSFANKGIKKFYENGSVTGIQTTHRRRLQLILSRLEVIKKPEDMNLPGFDFHKLSGTLKNQYSVSVNKNWRITFKFDGQHACEVDYIDYH